MAREVWKPKSLSPYLAMGAADIDTVLKRKQTLAEGANELWKHAQVSHTISTNSLSKECVAQVLLIPGLIYGVI
jgi:hypothetical protein